MLALSDAALARLTIAATAVPHYARSQWLQQFAKRVDPTPGAIRLRKHRQRQRDGISIFRLALPIVAIEEMLREDNLLPLDPTHEQVEAALQSFLTRLAELAAAID